MKKLLITLTLSVIAFAASALNLTITNQSFTETDSITQGSEQWLDIKSSGGYTSSDWFTITIAHVNVDGSVSNAEMIVNEQYYIAFDDLPFNPDGSIRYKFNIPSNYRGGKFRIMISFSTQKVYGLLKLTENDKIKALTITSQSFTETDSIQQKSIQWLDIKSSGFYNSTDKFTITIEHVNSSGPESNSAVLINELYQTAFNGLPFNQDGSQRIEFNMPDRYIGGKFRIMISFSTQKVNGLIKYPHDLVSSIEDNYLIADDTKTYYDLIGNKVIPTTGLYIWKDAKGSSGKVHIQ